MTDQPFPFTPVPRKRARHDGCTEERQRALITALAETGSISEAARSAGVSYASAYNLYNHPEGASLRAAWDKALACGVSKLHDIAMDRAVKGVPVPVFYRGEQVGEYRRFSESVLLTLLRHHAFGQHSSPFGTASRATKDRHAAENCPTCRARREAEAADNSEEQALAAAEELLHRYALKITSERQHRLAGQIVAADFTLRQITWMEIMLEGCGMGDLLRAAWNERSDLLHAVPTDLTRELDAIKQQVWADLGDPPRPAQRLAPDAAQDTAMWGGPTAAPREQARRAAEARMAQAQAEWEAAGMEDSWRAWCEARPA